ncbi:apomucin [Drosophila innubila]|uniref:apomucin n=1 Tax=Drosophila innubila TaxID=198719 RepID=UPI00148CBDD6|nr:apomucin [Drosophila innubila]
MWRLQLFLLLSTCCLIPHEAKPTTRATPTVATGRSNNIGRLAAKDLADLLLASMQARGVKLTTHQESMVKSLQDMESLEQQSGAVLLQLGMDLIIDVLIGSSSDASCDRVIKDIKHSKDNNILTLSLKSFLALCNFNNIECSQKQVVQIIKSTAAFKQANSTIEGSRSTRTALQQSGKSSSGKGDRESMVQFLQARNLKELTTICSSLLQMCGASSIESQNIIQNLVEMGPQDNTKSAAISVLQVNAFSTLILSLMDSMSSISYGNESGFCAATPECWMVRLLNMGVEKVVILGLLTALDRSAPTSPNSLIQQGKAAANLVDADVPLKKGAHTSKRQTGTFVGNQRTSGSKDGINGNGNTINKVVDADIPVVANVVGLNAIKGLVGGGSSGSSRGTSGGSSGGTSGGRPGGHNTGAFVGNSVFTGSKDGINGNGNTINTLVGADIPVVANVAALNVIKGLVGGGSSGSSGGTSGGSSGGSSGGTSGRRPGGHNTGAFVGNSVFTGSKDGINGNGNTINKVVDADIPVVANVVGLNAIKGLVGGGSSGSSGGTSGGSSGGTSGGTSGGSSGGSSGSSSGGRPGGHNTGAFVGNNVFTGSKDGITGNDNTINTLVGLDLPVNLNAVALNVVKGVVGGSSPDPNDVVHVVDEQGNQLLSIAHDFGPNGGNTGTSVGNTATTGPRQLVMGNNNNINRLINVNADVVPNLNLANAIRGSGGVCIGNKVKTGPKTQIVGDNNTVNTGVDIDLKTLLNLSALSSIIGTVGNDCIPETETPQPPTPEPPTEEPPTPQPPTPQPPTPQPPTPQPPTPQPPTPQPPTPYPPTPTPPTPTPPTPSPPTPNPNNCYRRYCRKWRTRPSYLCYKNCGGSYVYRP